MQTSFEFGWEREVNTDRSVVTEVTTCIHVCRLTYPLMSDAERDERTGDQWIASAIAYLNFNAGDTWRKLHRSGERYNETRWYFKSAANLINQLRYSSPKPCVCSRCAVESDLCRWAFEELLQIAGQKGAKDPFHYLFPIASNRGEYNPNKPMTNSGIKKPWESLREAAGLKWLRIHDLRHSAITRLAEAGVPTLVIMSIAGHVSQRMLQHYTTISEMSKRQALRAAMPVQTVLKIPSAAKKQPAFDLVNMRVGTKKLM
jgi:hypothetical protein